MLTGSISRFMSPIALPIVARPKAAPVSAPQSGSVPPTANPEWEFGWTWINASFNVQLGNNDEYQSSFTAPAPGSYRYAYRFSLDGGSSWTYCDSTQADGGSGSSPGLTFEFETLPVLNVTP